MAVLGVLGVLTYKGKLQYEDIKNTAVLGVLGVLSIKGRLQYKDIKNIAVLGVGSTCSILISRQQEDRLLENSDCALDVFLSFSPLFSAPELKLYPHFQNNFIKHYDNNIQAIPSKSATGLLFTHYKNTMETTVI